MESIRRNFCRLVTEIELDDEQIIHYYDIVQSIVTPKLVVGYTDDDKVSVDVTAYSTDDGFLYEIILEEQINLDEGEQIADIMLAEFDFDFEFETSLQVDE